MKRSLIFLILVVLFLVSGCSSKNEDSYYKTNQVKRLTLPYKYLEIDAINLETYINNLKDEDEVFSIEKEEDALTLSLSEEKLEEFKTAFFDKLQNFINLKLEELSDQIINISYSQDMSEFLVITPSKEITNDLEELFFKLFKAGGLYQAFLFKDPENTNVVVNILNNDENLVIGRFNSLDYINTDDHDHSEDFED